jgi:hypothetical protein
MGTTLAQVRVLEILYDGTSLKNMLVDFIKTNV